MSETPSPTSEITSNLENFSGFDAPSDSSGLTIPCHRLNGNNFLEWSQSVKIFHLGRERLDYVTGEIKKPAVTDAGFAKWMRDNGQVMTWLLNSMTPSISRNFLLYTTAAEIWSAVRETYSSTDNIAELYHVEDQEATLKQGTMPVTLYYNTLTALWQQLDLYAHYDWVDPRDVALYQQIVTQQRLFQFLQGLNKDLDEVRGRVLAISPLPSLREAFSMVKKEEIRRCVMLSDEPYSTSERSALLTHQSSPSSKRGRPWCDHCKKPGHSKEKCWKLHGKPQDWKAKHSRHNKSSLVVATSVTSFTKEQIAELQKLFEKFQGSCEGNLVIKDPEGNLSSTAFFSSQLTPNWILDSGATDHMTGNKALFHNFFHTFGKAVKTDDGTLCKIEGHGTVILNEQIALKNVLFVPNLACNLISVSKLSTDLHCSVIFNDRDCTLQALNSKKMIGKANLHNGLYILPTSPKIEISKSFTALGKVDTVMLWHFRLGHPSFQYLAKLFPALFINKRPNFFSCKVCSLAKHTKSSYFPFTYKPSYPFALIHSDIWGPSRVKNADNCKWFITFIDDHSRRTWTYLLKDKSETASVFVQFYNMVLTQFGSKIQLFKSNNGSEFFARSLGDFFKEKGIVQISSCVGTPQQNDIAKRKNRHLLEVTRSLLFTTNVPKYLWGKALLTATYLINRMPSKFLKFQTPQSIFLQHFPHFKPISSILPLKIFGCTVFIQNIAPNKSKLDPKSLKCVLVGYSSLKKGYKCYHPPSKRFFTTMDITFYEQNSYFTQAENQGETWSDFQPQQVSPPNLHSQPSELPSCSPLPADLSPVNAPIDSPVVPMTNLPTPTLNTLPENTPTPIDTAEMEEEISKSTTLDDFPIAIRKGVRQCTKHPIEKFTSYNSLMLSFQAFTATLDKEQVPTSIAEALKDPKWRRAVEEEICALEKNATWTITDLPQEKKAVGCKWIFAVKYNSNGMAKLNTIRVLLSLAVNCDWKLHQLDIKNAFLNGKLEEEVYMQLPPGSKSIEGSNKVCKLNKYLYGLKQSPRAWFEKFTKVILQNGYKQSLADHTLFIKVTSTNKKAILIVYVDDIILTGDDEEEISNLKKLLNREFETKDFGKLRYFLGMEVARLKEGLVINQRKYVLDLLKETGFLGCKPADTLMEANLRFNKEDESLVDREKFQRLVGKLIYLSLTRPDIAFPVNVISQHMTNPTEEHMAAANRILKYLKKTSGHGLMFKKTQDRTVKIFTDFSWA
ncbi:hypothetical protein PVK06_039741 [Gossypium arboreum]|uniref:Integrase catalytic domain-containing protein n=1 Tax=Gossypium arboreum TaxID=29729 RepID=A0ABR0N5V4_GOSAR|nr:hypothetical protein PVK06_039741 [Gossypium arboreum]